MKISKTTVNTEEAITLIASPYRDVKFMNE